MVVTGPNNSLDETPNWNILAGHAAILTHARCATSQLVYSGPVFFFFFFSLFPLPPPPFFFLRVFFGAYFDESRVRVSRLKKVRTVYPEF